MYLLWVIVTQYSAWQPGMTWSDCGLATWQARYSQQLHMMDMESAPHTHGTAGMHGMLPCCPNAAGARPAAHMHVQAVHRKQYRCGMRRAMLSKLSTAMPRRASRSVWRARTAVKAMHAP